MCVNRFKFKFILILILIFCLINFIFIGCCFALTMSPSNFNKTDSDVFDYLVSVTYPNIDLNNVNNWASSTYYQNYIASLDLMHGASYNAFTNRGVSTSLYVFSSNTDITFNVSSSVKVNALPQSFQFLITKQTNGLLAWSGQTPNGYKNATLDLSNITSSGYLLAYTTNGWYELSEGTIHLNDIIVPPSFTPLYDHVISVSGISENVYNFNQYLGGYPDTTNFGIFSDNFNDFIVDISLNKYWDLNTYSTIAHTTFYKTFFSNSAFNFDDLKLRINDRYLEYNTIYSLSIIVYKDYDDLNLNNPLTSYSYYYYITTPTSSIGSGNNINYSGNSNFIPPNIDNNINNTNDNSQVNNIMGSFLSGDLASKMGYDTSIYENSENGQYWNFLWGFWNNCYDVLIDSQNVPLTFNIRGDTYTLYSNDFITPNGFLKTFCSTLLVVGFFFLMYQQITQFIHEIEEGDLLVMHDTDADIYFYDL